MRAGRALPLLLAAALSWSAPAPAVPAPAPPPPAAIDEQDLDAFGTWLQQLEQIEAPLQAELQGLSAAWAEASTGVDMATATVRIRPTLIRILAAIDRADAGLRAMAAPQFPGLALPEDVRPDALHRQLLGLNSSIRTGIEGFQPLFEAAANHDTAAATAALRRVMDSFHLVFETQILFARAGRAMIPRDNPAWEVQTIRLIFIQAMARITSISTGSDNIMRDPALGPDLLRLADALDAAADRSAAEIEENVAMMSQSLAEAERARDAETASALRPALAILAANREAVPLARSLAVILRSNAANLGDGPIPVTFIGSMFRQVRPIRDGMQAMSSHENAALAGAAQ